MASVRELAAALNLEEKLSVCPSTPDHGMTIRMTVQLSSIWSSLISHLRSSVKVKRRRVHLKSHDGCFLGSEAVDVVADHIVHAKGFEDADVSRDKVACVCQALLDCKVFETVGTNVFGKGKRHDVFQDGKGALYRFLNTDCPSVTELDRGVLSHGIQNFFCGQGEPTSTHDAPVQLCTPVEDEYGVVDEVWKEQTVLRLLQLVDLPLLDGVMQCIQNDSSPARPPRPLTQSSDHLDRRILKAFRDAQEDEWLCAALDCLDFLPDQPVVELSRELPRFFPQDQHSFDCQTGESEVWQPRCVPSPDCDHKEQSGFAQCKLLLYGTLTKHYSRTDRPALMPQHLSDVYIAINDLLVNAQVDKALEALQLCLKLLPSSCRDELRMLLTFMALAVDPQALKLDKDVENMMAVKRSLFRAVLHNRRVSKETEDLVLLFMLANIEDLFKIHGALHRVVSDKLASLVHGKLPDVTGSMFCRQISNNSLINAAQIATNQELWNLLKNIDQDLKTSAKNRKRLLGQFYQAHPGIYNQYFSDSAPSVV